MKISPFLDANANSIPQAKVRTESDWDALSEWATGLVGPTAIIRPYKTIRAPQSKVYSTQIGRIGISRTQYGATAKINLEGFSGAPVITTTNISGHATPQLDGREPITNGLGKSFVFDLSQRSHESLLSADNIQLQLVMCPKLLDEVCLSWFGHVPDRKNWQIRTRFGGIDTSWYACLQYVLQLISSAQQPLTRRNVRHIEETLAANLLENWAAQSGVILGEERHTIVPQVIRLAEAYMVEYAPEAPTLADVAKSLNVSVRNLTMNFKKYRGCSPGQFLREQRLQAARKELLAADQGQTVNQIAASLSYIHMGEFAKVYRQRFGELPSETLKRSS